MERRVNQFVQATRCQRHAKFICTLRKPVVVDYNVTNLKQVLGLFRRCRRCLK